MIYGFVDPLDHLFVEFHIQNYFKNVLLKTYVCKYGLTILSSLERRAPKNDEDQINKISKIKDMRLICIKKHEWIVANTVPRSTTKHRMTFGKFWAFRTLSILASGKRGVMPKIRNMELEFANKKVILTTGCNIQIQQTT